MAKLNFRITPVNGYDIPALERWLEQLASQGLFFSATAGPLTLFDRGEPVRVQIHLEPAREKTDQEDLELNALYQAAGWRFLGIFRKNFYVYASQDPEARAHTDPQVLDYSLRRFARQKLLGGLGLLLGNLCLLAFFHTSSFDLYSLWSQLRDFPLETCSRYNLLPLSLSAMGLALVDLSYLLGLMGLRRYRNAVQAGTQPPGARRSAGGWLLAAGVLILLLVGAEVAAYFTGKDYSPYPLEDSGFVTLAEIEGPDFRITGDYMFNMDYISHGNTPLRPESWYFCQYGAFSHYDGGVSLNQVPHLELTIKRYLLPALAAQQADEWSRVRDYSYSSAGYQTLPDAHGFDQALSARGETGMALILRRGNTVLLAEYRGETDLLPFLPRFAAMFGRL